MDGTKFAEVFNIAINVYAFLESYNVACDLHAFSDDSWILEKYF